MSDFKNEKLKNAFHLYVDDLVKNLESFPWENKKAYSYWLAQTYYFVRHTTVLLALTAAKFGNSNRDRQYSALKHIREELNHDLLPLEDLKALGTSIDQIPELPETSAFYQSQYYFVTYVHPIALYGYALALEGLAAKKGPDLYEILKKSYGEKGTKFIKLHAVVDQDHFEEGLEDFKDITDVEAESVIRNLTQSAYLYRMMLSHIRTICTVADKKIA